MKTKNLKSIIFRQDVGKRIYEIRNSLDFTLKTFGSQFRNPVSPAVVLKWERGTNFPSDEHIVQIAKLGEVSLTWLLFGSDYDNLQNHLLPEVFQRLEKMEMKLRSEVTNEAQARVCSNIILQTLDSLNSNFSVVDEDTQFSIVEPKIRLQQIMEISFSSDPTYEEVLKFNALFNQLTMFVTAKKYNPDTYEDNLDTLDGLLWLSGNHPEEVYNDNKIFRQIVDADGLEVHIDKVTNRLHENIDKISSKLKEKYIEKVE